MTEIIKKARKVYRRWLRGGYLGEGQYEVRLKPNFNTAAWIYDAKSTEPLNTIVIGEQALEAFAKEGYEEETLQLLMHHELGHSRFTTRDMPLVKKQLEVHAVPFPLFNLFEDCRMERKVANEFGIEMYWEDVSKPEINGYGHYSPESLLLMGVYHGGKYKPDTIDAFIGAGIEKGIDEGECERIAQRVTEYYYPKIVAQPSTFRLFPIMSEWREEFTTQEQRDREQQMQELADRMAGLLQQIAQALSGSPDSDEAEGDEGEGPGEGGTPESASGDEGDEQSDTGEGKGGDSEDGKSDDSDEDGDKGRGKTQIEDMELSEGLSEDDDAREEFLEDTTVMADESVTDSGSKEKPEGKGAGDKIDDFECDTYTLDEHSNADLTEYGGHRFDRDVMKKLLPKFERILKDKERKTGTTRPSKRFHSRNLIADREKVYKRKEEVSVSKKSISLVYDCSGSMGLVMKDLKIIAAVVNRLAYQKKAEGYLILSSTCGYQSFKLPVNEKTIDAMAGSYGGEGLDETFEATLPLLRKSDYVFCVTDGDIGSRAVDQSALRRQGVDPIGLYCGREPVNLYRWFRRVIWRRDIESLIEAIVKKVKQ